MKLVTKEAEAVTPAVEGAPSRSLNPGVDRYTVGSRPAGRFTALIFADAGIGKTHLISTTPVDTLVVSCDLSGAETLEKTALVAAVRERGVRLDVQEAFMDKDAFKILNQTKLEVEMAIRKGQPLPYRMIVLDGLCALEDSITQDLVAQGGPYVQPSRPEMLSQGGWGCLGARHLRVRRAALSIPRVHVIFTALERTRGDEDTKVNVVDAALSGQQGRRYKADVSYVLHLESRIMASGQENYLVFDRAVGLAVKARRGDLLGHGSVPADLSLVMSRLGYLGESTQGDAGTGPTTQYGPGEAPEKETFTPGQ